MSSELETSVRDAPPMVVLDLRGDVTSFAIDPLKAAFVEASGMSTRTILVNFEGVNYLNSAGIAAIIALIGEARKAHRQLLLTGLSAHYQMIFDMMGLTAYAPVFQSEEAARRSVSFGT
jgi:stage II sporulation protein AA (anti-sigma F factor antagonist)